MYDSGTEIRACSMLVPIFTGDGFQHYFHYLPKSERLQTRRHRSVGVVMAWSAVAVKTQVYIELLETEVGDVRQSRMDSRITMPFTQREESHSDFLSETSSFLIGQGLSPDLNIIENGCEWLLRKIYLKENRYHCRLALIDATDLLML